MSIIIKKLDGETVNLPTPKQPAFFVGNLTKIQTCEKQNKPRENTRQRKQSHAQDNIYMVRQFAYIHIIVEISLLSGKKKIQGTTSIFFPPQKHGNNSIKP